MEGICQYTGIYIERSDFLARPFKEGLEYFPKDTGFYQDRKIKSLLARFGCDGVVLYDYILCESYADKGYYLSIDDDFQENAAIDLRVSVEKIGLMLDYLLKRSLLISIPFSAVTVLTSHGIQRRYQLAVKSRGAKRDVFVNGMLWLLDESETESFIKVHEYGNKSEINGSKSEINPSKSKEECTKAKEIKVNESIPKKKSSASCDAPSLSNMPGYCSLPSSVQEKIADWLKYKQEKRQPYKTKGLQALITQVVSKCAEHGEIAVIACIDLSMANNWQGIIWDRIKKSGGGETQQRTSGNPFLDKLRRDGEI